MGDLQGLEAEGGEMSPRVKDKPRLCSNFGCDKVVAKYYHNGVFKSYRKRCKDHHGYNYRKGILNPYWKGGRRTSKDGYVLVLDSRRYERRGLSRYILEHRLILEGVLGRPLLKHEIVHHLNGIRDDNRTENLCLINIKTDKHSTWTLSKDQADRIRRLEKTVKALKGELCQE